MAGKAFFAIFTTITILSFTSAAPVSSIHQREACPRGLIFLDYGNCPSGFVGCGVESQCQGSGRFFTTTGECPSGRGTLYRCSDPQNPDTVFWRGCTAESDVCTTILGSLGAPESPKPAPEVVQPEPGTPIATEKPKKCDGIDYWYNPVGGCPSGFVGCMSRKDYCSGTQRFWGTCPPELGNYYVCSNGFRGCTRDTSICDKPAFAKE